MDAVQPLPMSAPPEIRAKVVAVRRRKAAERGESDPYPDEPVSE